MEDAVCREKTLVCLAQNGDASSLSILIEKHYPLIRSLAQRVCSTMEKDALIQAGCLGMIQAVKHYRCEQEVKLITYAVPWILGEMKKALRHEIMPSADFSLEQKWGTEEDRFIEHIAGYDGIDLRSIDLHVAFDMLDQDERRLILLRYYRGKTQKETAMMMRKSQTQISRIENRVLDALRIQLS